MLKNTVLFFLVAALLTLAACDNPAEESPRQLSHIVITETPAKTVYGIGEACDITGLALSAVYSDGTEEAVSVTEDMTSAGPADWNAEAGPDKSVTFTVNYGGKSASFKRNGVGVYPFVARFGDGETEPYFWIGYNSLAAALVDVPGQTVTITLFKDPEPFTSDFKVGTDTVLTLVGYGAERTIRRTGSAGRIFTAGEVSSDTSRSHLILGNNITLRDNPDAPSTLGAVNVLRYFTMLEGSRITGFQNISASYSVVNIGNSSSNAVFTMKGGEITGNRAAVSTTGLTTHGVYVGGGKFIMEGGVIEGEGGTGDVVLYRDSDGRFTLGKNAHIGTLIIQCAVNAATGAASYCRIVVEAGWTGTVDALHLYNENTLSTTAITGEDAIAAVSAAWNGRELLVPAEGYEVTAADIATITLGDFIGRKGASGSGNYELARASIVSTGCRLVVNSDAGASLEERN